MKSILAVLLLATSAIAADPQVQRDVAFVEPKNERQILDVYSPTDGKNHPVVVWVHGGGWTKGSKNGMQQKPQAFTERGFIFVPINYRFVPTVTVKEMTGDIAKVIR